MLRKLFTAIFVVVIIACVLGIGRVIGLLGPLESAGDLVVWMMWIAVILVVLGIFARAPEGRRNYGLDPKSD